MSYEPMKLLEEDNKNLVSVLDGDKFIFSSKNGMTNVSEDSQAFVELRPKYTLFVKAMLDIGAIPTFEWLSDEDNLILVSLQKKKSGEFYSYKQIKEFCNWFEIPLIKT